MALNHKAAIGVPKRASQKGQEKQAGPDGPRIFFLKSDKLGGFCVAELRSRKTETGRRLMSSTVSWNAFSPRSADLTSEEIL